MDGFEKEEDIEDADSEESTEVEHQEDAADKHESFLRLSAARVQKAEKYISAIGRLSNKSSYSYSQDEIEKIFEYLQKSLDDAKAQFAEQPKSHFSW
jgi:hypothetical protein